MPSDVKALLAKGRNHMKPKTRDIGKKQKQSIKKKSYHSQRHNSTFQNV